MMENENNNENNYEDNYENNYGIIDFLKQQEKWKYVLLLVLLALIGGIAFFMNYYKVTAVEVMDSNYYTKEQIKEMVLDGPFTNNSVLAPILYSKEGMEDVPFVKGFSVTALNRNTLCITVKEEIPVGCIPYLDNYIYFNREGIFTESAQERDEKIPYFSGIVLEHVIKGEKLPMKGKTILDTAVALASIFQKNDLIPDYIDFDVSNNISLIYGDITVQLGRDQYLEDKMARVLAILPKLEGKKGVLHMENITDHVKTVTFEEEQEEITAENWPGGYDENGDYTGYDEYDVNGKYVGPKPMGAYDYALEAWPGGYDEEGDYTGAGVYDAYGQYVGEAPTKESIAENGDWLGGYDEDGRYITTGEYDREGYYVGPKPGTETEESSEETDEEDESYDDESYDDESYEDESYDDGEASWDDPDYWEDDEDYDSDDNYWQEAQDEEAGWDDPDYWEDDYDDSENEDYSYDDEEW